MQVELAWTITPILISLVLFLATARVIFRIQGAVRPSDAVDVTVIGHQFWWEYRYPGLNVVTANELHVPVSDPNHPSPTFLKLYSADTDHSWWVPRLAGKTDLIPNHPNSTWIEPRVTGLYLGQSARYCGTQHAKMLLRVYVQSREDFATWVEHQRQKAQTVPADGTVAEGRRVFEAVACINCHTVARGGSIGHRRAHRLRAGQDRVRQGMTPQVGGRDPNRVQNCPCISDIHVLSMSSSGAVLNGTGWN